MVTDICSYRQTLMLYRSLSSSLIMSKIKKAENEFVSFAITLLSNDEEAIEGNHLLNRFFSSGVAKYTISSRRQLLTALRKHDSIYARILSMGGFSKTYYSLHPILSKSHKNDGSKCNSRRYKLPSN